MPTSSIPWCSWSRTWRHASLKWLMTLGRKTARISAFAWKPVLTEMAAILKMWTIRSSFKLKTICQYIFFGPLKQHYRNETPPKGICYEFCKFFRNTYFVKHLWKAASIYCQANINLEKSLLVRNWLLIHLIQLCQKYKNILLIHSQNQKKIGWF